MTDANQWRIAPNEGLLPVQFGETAESIGTLPNLGAVTQVLPGGAGETTEFRGLAEPTISYRDNGVFYIAVGRQTANVLFEGTDVFAVPPRTALQAFETANDGPGFVQLDRVVFQRLGLAIEGFYFLDEDAYFDPESGAQDDRLVILHAPGTLEIFDDLPRTVVTFF